MRAVGVAAMIVAVASLAGAGAHAQTVNLEVGRQPKA